MDLITTQDNAAQEYTQADLPQLKIKTQFMLEQGTRCFLEAGKLLVIQKKLVPHGQWEAWLNDNFSLTERTAQRFMQISERFSGKSVDVDGFKPSQLTEMLSLPDAEETEKFIAKKAAEGKAVADMTIKQLREEIAQYKATIEDERQAHQQNLFDRAREAQELSEQVTLAKMELGKQLNEVPKAGNGGANQYQAQSTTVSTKQKPKSETIAELGLTQKQAEHYQLMAKGRPLWRQVKCVGKI